MPTRRMSLAAIAVASAALIGATLAGSPSSAAPPAKPAAEELAPIVVGSPERLEVLPAKIQLDGPRRRMRLIVSGFYPGAVVQDLTRAAEFAATNPQVVRVENGVAIPVGDGSGEIVVRCGGKEVRVPVVVAKAKQPDPVSFQHGALVALSKQGCNSGACHGSPSGKGGFRLSLRAYDPPLDELTLIREDFGRRTNPADPTASLLLAKPLMETPHGGGRKLRPSDPAYELLRDWIAEGCRLDPADAPHCVRLELAPAGGRVIRRPAHTQQLLAWAHFSDGSIRDVTPLAIYTSSDDAVASVDAAGLVVAHERGAVAIVVRYLDKVETCSLTFLKDVPGFQWPNPPRNNYIDEHVQRKLAELQYTPADLCRDDEFIRRVYLDVIGQLPTIDETRAFLADAAADKRAKLIDALLARPEFARFWALKLGDLLRLNAKGVTADGVQKYHRWLVRSLETNMPYDEFARELLTASGSTFENPAANFYRASADVNDCTEATAQLFLGVRIQCAKCHNHPFERWTQDNYYGLAALFNRVQKKPAARKDEQVVWVARTGEVTQPRTGKQMKPWLPLKGDAEVAADVDRREVFAGWLTSPDNPFFARVEVNRLWAHLLGRGIVEPVDDFRDSNPPANGPLLDALAADFVQHRFDRKHVLRTILNSRTYQASVETNDFNKDDARYFSHAKVRLLAAEQLLDAICQVTAVEENYPGLPAGTRATQLPSPDVNHEFLKVFGQPERQTVCQCERTTESNLSQALQLINGPLVHGKLRSEHNRLRKLVAAGKNDAEIVGELYLAALCRQPSPEELAAATKHVAAQKERLAGLEDLCWVLINMNEFLFQH